MFSDALREMDRNTEKYMVEELNQQVRELKDDVSNLTAIKDTLTAQNDTLTAQNDTLANQHTDDVRLIEQLQKEIEELRKSWS